MADTILSYNNRRRFVVRKWLAGTKYYQGNVVVNGDKIYKVNVDFIPSNDNPAVYDGGNVTRLDRRITGGGFRDIGPYYASAGYYAVSEGRDTGNRYSNYNDNEVVVGYAPLAQNADDGDWTDGGRVTVRFGFTLRLKKINKVD